MKPKIRLTVLHIDQGDDMIHFQGSFSNAFCSTILEFYGYSDEFQKFATDLIEFPKTTLDKATFEIGKKGDKWTFYLFIEAYCIELNGQSALKIEATNNEKGHLLQESRFSLESEPASLNRLGKRLKNWNPLEEKLFEWRPNE